jgi:hypothetical protein
MLVMVRVGRSGAALLGLAALVATAPAAGQAETAAPPAAAPAPATPPATGAAPAPAGTAPGSDTAAPAKPAEPAKPSVTGGYSWTEKKPAARRRRPVAKFDPTKPLATYPGFRMLANGTSRIWVQVSKPVDVQVRRAGGTVTYVLPGVNVGVRNNTNPLVTTHFNTPVSRARLVPDRAGVLLVLELRETAEPAHKVVKSAYGTMTLEVTLPRSTRDYSALPEPRAPRSGRALPSSSSGQGSGKRGPGL